MTNHIERTGRRTIYAMLAIAAALLVGRFFGKW
ncbi:hypothetical protein ABIF81_002839 [Bradyrhizobium daqingense]